MERIGTSPAWHLSLGRCYAWVRPGEWKQYLLIMARIYALVTLSFALGRSTRQRVFGARPGGSSTIARAAQARRAENPIERFVVIGMGNLRNVLFIVGDANGCDPLR